MPEPLCAAAATAKARAKARATREADRGIMCFHRPLFDPLCRVFGAVAPCWEGGWEAFQRPKSWVGTAGEGEGERTGRAPTTHTGGRGTHHGFIW